MEFTQLMKLMLSANFSREREKSLKLGSKLTIPRKSNL